MARRGAAWATTSSSGSLVAPIPPSPGSHPLQHYLLATKGNTRQHKATQHNARQHKARQHKATKSNSQLDSAAAATTTTTTHPD
mmetsp:Transcript_1692/g.4453  ORF Transcript_1692/g.4453 Transcript_1692/m.4453 type:complete len:84 (+) Transcript_1692:998-1249(+)